MTPTATTCGATSRSSSDVPDKYLREPWTMPAEVQEDCGVRIGEDYPGADG